MQTWFYARVKMHCRKKNLTSYMQFEKKSKRLKDSWGGNVKEY